MHEAGSNLRVVGVACVGCAVLLGVGGSLHPPFRQLAVLGGTGGVGAFVAMRTSGWWLQRLLVPILIVEGVFVVFQGLWAASTIRAGGQLPIAYDVVLPFWVLLALHHGGLTLMGGVVGALAQVAMRTEPRHRHTAG